jgi:F-type H+-transporting ATPase subunit delta
VADKALDGVRTFGEVFLAAPEAQEAFDSPAVPREAKERLLDELLAKYPVEPVVANFLHVLLEHNRMRYYRDILGAFEQLVNERKGVVQAKVVTASPLDADELGKIAARLGEATGKQVALDAATDQDLLGGMVVNIGSTVYDGSVRTQLEAIRRRLMER